MILGSYGCGEKVKIVPAPVPYTRMQEINWTDVTWTNGFWAEKIKLCSSEIIPALYKALMSDSCNAQLKNLKIAAGLEEGKFQGDDWSDGECYKWIESMAYIYGITKEPALDSIMDEWIGIIAKAQLPDGYISTNITLRDLEPYGKPATSTSRGGTYHEMYNQGHLLTAACVHFMATGKDNFLIIARKLADHLCIVFKPGAPQLSAVNGNMPQIMGLIDLYRITGEKRYIEAAQLAIDIRATQPFRSDFTNDHVPFREETEAVGHSVFANYLFAGVADVFAETGEKALMDALERIWENGELRRTYITGGVGSTRLGVSARGDQVWEGFGSDYELPNRTAYNETCANIGNAMWNWRMAMITGETKYTDIVEKVIYNSMLSGVSLEGSTFFYPNPLAWYVEKDGSHGPHGNIRKLNIGFCCPTNLARTVAGIGRWAYSVSNDSLWVHLYGGNQLKTSMPDGKTLDLTQETLYPWDGKIKFTLTKTPKKPLSVMLRIPGWVEKPSLKVNGQILSEILVPGSYIAVNREWSAGDIIELDLPMEAKMMEANPGVKDCHDKLAVMRGPVVYCAEFPLSENGDSIWNSGFYMPDNAEFKAEKGEGALNDITILKSSAFNEKEKKQYLENAIVQSEEKDTSGWEGVLYRKYIPKNLPKPENASLELTLIPYYAWANRGPAFMTVWIPMAR